MTPDAVAGARALADEICANAPTAVRHIRAAVLRGSELDLADGLAVEAEMMAAQRATADSAEGVAAFIAEARARLAGAVAMARLEVLRGDITAQADVDAIVNAANERLAAGAGVCGAIRRAGGAAIFEEAARLGGCATGDAKTDRRRRPAEPVRRPCRRPGLLGWPARRRAARVVPPARDRGGGRLGCRSIAFPAISTGIYGYPIDEAAPVAVAAAREAAAACGLDLVRFVLFSEPDLAAFEAAAGSAT